MSGWAHFPILFSINEVLLKCIASCNLFVISHRAEGPGHINPPPPPRPSDCLSVTFTFRNVTQQNIAVFSRNLAGLMLAPMCHSIAVKLAYILVRYLADIWHYWTQYRLCNGGQQARIQGGGSQDSPPP